MGCVYCATNLVNGKKYIGKTVGSLECRKSGHTWDTLKGSPLYFHRALRKYGFENFEWDILFVGDDEEILLKVEMIEICSEGTMVPAGYNMTAGGRGVWKIVKSDYRKSQKKTLTLDHRMKIGAFHKGRNTGKSYVEIYGIKIAIRKSLNHSMKMKGVAKTEEHRKAIGESLKGKKKSPEHCANLSAAHKGLNKGKTYEEIYGPEMAAKLKEMRRISTTLANNRRKELKDVVGNC